MNRSAIRTLVLEATKRTDKTTLINTAIDLAVAEVSSQRSWSDLQVEADVTTTAEQGYVDLASDLARIAEVRLINASSPTNSWKLHIRPKIWLVSRYPNISSISSGKPCYGYMEGTRLYLLRIPDSAYTIRYTYYRLHPSLAGDSDEVLIRHANAAVVAWATYWVFLSLEKPDDAAAWLKTYAIQLESAKKVDADNSAVEQLADIRGEDVDPALTDYWLDPMVKRMP